MKLQHFYRPFQAILTHHFAHAEREIILAEWDTYYGGMRMGDMSNSKFKSLCTALLKFEKESN